MLMIYQAQRSREMRSLQWPRFCKPSLWRPNLISGYQASGHLDHEFGRFLMVNPARFAALLVFHEIERTVNKLEAARELWK